MRFALLANLLATLVWCLMSADANCEEASAAKTTDVTCKTKESEPPPFTPEREAASLEFVRQHHPELIAVLEQLKGLKRDEYEQAIREIAQTAERLAMLKSTDEALYGLSLEAWKVDSQIKLLAARLAFAAKHDPAVESELKQLLYKLVDLQRRHVEHNRDRALASLATMNANIKLLTDKRDEFVERRLKMLVRIPTKATGKLAPQPTVKSPTVPQSDR